MRNTPGIGTVGFFYVPKPGVAPPVLTPGKFYFSLRVHSVRVIATGGWWQDVNSVALVTEATFSGGTAPATAARNLNKAVRFNSGIRDTRIAASNNMISRVPATMGQVNFGVSLAVTRRKLTDEFLNLLSSETFATAVGFSTGTLAVVKAIGSVVPSLINVFKGETPAKEDALTITADFDFALTDLKPGFYVALGAKGINDEIPRLVRDDQLKVLSNDLLLDDQSVKEACYVVLELQAVRFVGIDSSTELWVKLYRRATRELEDVISGVTLPEDRANTIAEARKSLFAIGSSQEEDMTMTEEEKKIFLDRLKALFQQATAALSQDDMSFAGLALPADMEMADFNINAQQSAFDDYQRELAVAQSQWEAFDNVPPVHWDDEVPTQAVVAQSRANAAPVGVA